MPKSFGKQIIFSHWKRKDLVELVLVKAGDAHFNDYYLACMVWGQSEGKLDIHVSNFILFLPDESKNYLKQEVRQSGKDKLNFSKIEEGEEKKLNHFYTFPFEKKIMFF